MIILTKKDLATLCETRDSVEQMEVLEQLRIPYEVHPISGNVKVLVKDLTWAAERRGNEPNYSAA